MKTEVDIALLNERLVYNPGNGLLHWKERKPVLDLETMRWNAQYAGQEAGNKQDDGYIRLGFDGVKLAAHRVIWAMAIGAWPKIVIDHINGDTSDNRFCNLREASISQNTWNQRTFKTNTSGYKGVSFFRRTGRWKACISANGKREFLGYFDTAELASAAYSEAANRLHGEFARAA